MENLAGELKNYGERVLLCYGGGSIRKNGIYDQVIATLNAAGKIIVEDSGVMPNPTVEKLMEGRQRARDGKVDFILAVGGGSVVDYAKAVSASVYCEDDPWEKYYLRGEAVSNPIIPLGCVLTMVGTGSEMNSVSVITNHQQKRKIGHTFEEELAPRFAIMNPEFSYTIPRYQMVSGIYDIFNHICEQYFSDEDDNTSDYIAEGLMRSLIHASRVAVKNPTDYEARSNIMWTATWAQNSLISRGKTTDWMVHMLGQAVAAYTDATHGMTLAAVSLPYYRMILPYGLDKFRRFAANVWNVDTNGKSDRQIAEDGLAAMESWMRELGLVMNIREFGVTEDMLNGIVDATFTMQGGYHVLTRDEIREVFEESIQHRSGEEG